jgi:hypothetical protein
MVSIQFVSSVFLFLPSDATTCVIPHPGDIILKNDMQGFLNLSASVYYHCQPYTNLALTVTTNPRKSLVLPGI